MSKVLESDFDPTGQPSFELTEIMSEPFAFSDQKTAMKVCIYTRKAQTSGRWAGE
jgi:hypothetical protein